MMCDYYTSFTASVEFDNLNADVFRYYFNKSSLNEMLTVHVKKTSNFLKEYFRRRFIRDCLGGKYGDKVSTSIKYKGVPCGVFLSQKDVEQINSHIPIIKKRDKLFNSIITSVNVMAKNSTDSTLRVLVSRVHHLRKSYSLALKKGNFIYERDSLYDAFDELMDYVRYLNIGFSIIGIYCHEFHTRSMLDRLG